MKSNSIFYGVFALPLIPFFEDETLDERSYVNELEFCLQAKVHGIAVPLESGEFYRLSDKERFRIAELTIQTVAGRCPVVVGVSATNTPLAVEFARHAQEIGADAILSTPPYITPTPFEHVIKYFRAIAAVCDKPIILQNARPPLAPTLSADAIYEIIRSVENIRCVKEEAIPTGRRISSLIDTCGDSLEGVFGGLGGKFMFNELARGSSGIMPSCQIVDVHVQIYEKYQNGNLDEAHTLFEQVLPLLSYDGDGMWLQNAKTILVKRGIIKTNVVRGEAGLDARDQENLERAFEKIAPYLLI